jgi:hypothetical protein
MVADLLGSLQPKDTTAARRQMAMALMNQGRSSAPIQSPWQGLANMASGLLGASVLGDVQNQEDTKKSAKAKALSEAIAAMAGGDTTVQEPVFGVPGAATVETKKPAAYAAALRLAQNDETAPMALDMTMKAQQQDRAQQQAEIDRQNTLRDRAAERESTQSFQRSQSQESMANQERLARLQIAATQGNSAAQRELQLEIAKMGQQDRAPNTIETAEGVFTLNRDGTLGNRLGSPKAGAAMNNDQSNAALYADRMRAADAILTATGPVQTDMKQRAMAAIPGVGNFLVSSEFQKADQAQRDFINATLRRESGAAISDGEFANARKQYFPQPGDGDEVLAQKAANRALAITGISRAAGPSYKPQTSAPPAPGQPDRLDRSMGAKGGLSPDEAAELASLRARFGGGK